METKPSFYKILMDLTPKLGLPEGFMEKYGEMLGKKAELRIGCGATWKVRIDKVEGERYFLTRGWTKFSQDMGLEIYQLLVFSYAGNSTFDVSVYATTALEKASDFRPVENPRCQVQLKEYHRYKFHVPSHFAKACGLKGKTEVWFEYPGGQSARVTLNSSKGRVDFGGGWYGFWKANGLAPHITYSFEFISTRNVIRVRPHGQ